MSSDFEEETGQGVDEEDVAGLKEVVDDPDELVPEVDDALLPEDDTDPLADKKDEEEETEDSEFMEYIYGDQLNEL